MVLEIRRRQSVERGQTAPAATVTGRFGQTPSPSAAAKVAVTDCALIAYAGSGPCPYDIERAQLSPSFIPPTHPPIVDRASTTTRRRHEPRWFFHGTVPLVRMQPKPSATTETPPYIYGSAGPAHLHQLTDVLLTCPET